MSELQLDLFDLTTSPVGVSVVDAESKLPRIAREIYQMIGLDGLVVMVNRWGGVHMDFPTSESNFEKSKIVQELADEIGMGDAFKVARHFQGTRLHMPQCTAALIEVRNAQIRQDLDNDVPAHKIAKRFKMSERNIWRIAKRI
jgi:Mor family transcriptional regulator